MKATVPTRASRIAIVVIAFGCQPDTTAPEVEIQAAKNPSKPVTASLAAAFTTALPQPVNIIAENKLKLELNADQAVFRSTIDLANTIAAGTVDCVADPADASADRKAALLLKLQDAEQNRHFNALVDKRSLGAVSAQHRIAHTWNEPDVGLFTLRIGSNNLQSGVNASVTETSTDVFRFTGGSVLVADRSGQVSDHLWMSCVNLDDVTLTLQR